MKMFAKVHPNSSQEKIEKISENEIKVWLKEKAINNKANASLIKVLKKHFKKEIKILSGFNSRKKIIEINL